MLIGRYSSATGISTRLRWAAVLLILVVCSTASVAEEHEEQTEERTAFEQLVWKIERAGRSAKPRRLERLVREIDEVLEEPAPLEETACWLILKATVQVELSRYGDARESFGVLADTCPVWEVLNNLAVLEARDGDYGPARKRLMDCTSSSDKGCGAIEKADWDEKAVPRANLRELTEAAGPPALLLAGVPVECNAETPIADCGAPARTTVRLSDEEERAPEEEQRETTTGVESDLPALGWVRLNVVPGDSSVYFDGVLVGSGDEVAGSRRVEARRHMVEVARPGYVTQRREFVVETGGEVVIDVLLKAEEVEREPEPVTGDVEPPQSAAEDPPAQVPSAAESEQGTESTPAAAAPQDRVRATIEAWERAWERAWEGPQRLEEYLGYYDADAVPPKRLENIRNKERIDVEVTDLELASPEEGAWEATFTQSYCGYLKGGGSYGDRGPKSLELRIIGKAWKIVHEDGGSAERVACE